MASSTSTPTPRHLSFHRLASSLDPKDSKIVAEYVKKYSGFLQELSEQEKIVLVMINLAFTRVMETVADVAMPREKFCEAVEFLSKFHLHPIAADCKEEMDLAHFLFDTTEKPAEKKQTAEHLHNIATGFGKKTMDRGLFYRAIQLSIMVNANSNFTASIHLLHDNLLKLDPFWKNHFIGLSDREEQQINPFYWVYIPFPAPEIQLAFKKNKQESVRVRDISTSDSIADGLNQLLQAEPFEVSRYQLARFASNYIKIICAHNTMRFPDHLRNIDSAPKTNDSGTPILASRDIIIQIALYKIFLQSDLSASMIILEDKFIELVKLINNLGCD